MASILLIDNDSSFLRFAELRLQELGHQVATAGTAEAALEAKLHREFDALVCDCSLETQDIERLMSGPFAPRTRGIQWDQRIFLTHPERNNGSFDESRILPKPLDWRRVDSLLGRLDELSHASRRAQPKQNVLVYETDIVHRGLWRIALGDTVRPIFVGSEPEFLARLEEVRPRLVVIAAGYGSEGSLCKLALAALHSDRLPTIVLLQAAAPTGSETPCPHLDAEGQIHRFRHGRRPDAILAARRLAALLSEKEPTCDFIQKKAQCS